jgi:hypothetical protein
MTLPAAPPPPPFEWGKVMRLQELLGTKLDLATEEGTNTYRFASGEQAWQLWVNHYGPTKSLATSLDDARREELRRAIVALHESAPSPLGFDMIRPYVITRGVKK